MEAQFPQQHLDWAASPLITGLPGLAFERVGRGAVMGRKAAQVCCLIVDDATLTSDHDRLAVGIRIGVWFHNGLKVLPEHPHKTHANQILYAFTQGLMRAQYPHIAKNPAFSAKKIRALFRAFERARRRHGGYEGDVIGPYEGPAMAFLQPIDLWVRHNIYGNAMIEEIKEFIDKSNWIETAMEHYKKEAGLDLGLIPDRAVFNKELLFDDGIGRESTRRRRGAKRHRRNSSSEATGDNSDLVQSFVFASDQLSNMRAQCLEWQQKVAALEREKIGTKSKEEAPSPSETLEKLEHSEKKIQGMADQLAVNDHQLKVKDHQLRLKDDQLKAKDADLKLKDQKSMELKGKVLEREAEVAKLARQTRDLHDRITGLIVAMSSQKQKA